MGHFFTVSLTKNIPAKNCCIKFVRLCDQNEATDQRVTFHFLTLDRWRHSEYFKTFSLMISLLLGIGDRAYKVSPWWRHIYSAPWHLLLLWSLWLEQHCISWVIHCRYTSIPCVCIYTQSVLFLWETICEAFVKRELSAFPRGFTLQSTFIVWMALNKTFAKKFFVIVQRDNQEPITIARKSCTESIKHSTVKYDLWCFPAMIHQSVIGKCEEFAYNSCFNSLIKTSISNVF